MSSAWRLTIVNSSIRVSSSAVGGAGGGVTVAVTHRGGTTGHKMCYCLYGPDVWCGWQLLTVWRRCDISDRSLCHITVWPCVCMQRVDIQTPQVSPHPVPKHHQRAMSLLNDTLSWRCARLSPGITSSQLWRFPGTDTVRLVYITSYCCMMADGSCKIRP